MKEFDIRLNRKMVSDLLLNGAIFVELEGRNGRYKISNLSSMTSRVADYVNNKEVRCFTFYCSAYKKNKEYRVKMVLKNVQGEDWYNGVIVFPSAPI